MRTHFGRVAGIKFLPPKPGVEVHRTRWHVQRRQIAGDGEAQIVDEFVLKMRMPQAIADLVTPHALQPQNVGHPVFDFVQGALEYRDLPVARALRFAPGISS